MIPHPPTEVEGSGGCFEREQSVQSKKSRLLCAAALGVPGTTFFAIRSSDRLIYAQHFKNCCRNRCVDHTIVGDRPTCCFPSCSPAVSGIWPCTWFSIAQPDNVHSRVLFSFFAAATSIFLLGYRDIIRTLDTSLRQDKSVRVVLVRELFRDSFLPRNTGTGTAAV